MLNQPGRFAFEKQGLVAILRDVADGNAAAFEELYRRTCAKLFGICLRVLSDRAEAEEALQDSYVAVWRRASTFDSGRGQPMTWLIAIARNQAIDRLRASRPLSELPIQLAPPMPDTSPGAIDILLATEAEAKMTACLDTLATADRAMIHTAFFQGSTYSELARRSSTPLGTVKTRMRRALGQLRDCLR